MVEKFVDFFFRMSQVFLCRDPRKMPLSGLHVIPGLRAEKISLLVRLSIKTKIISCPFEKDVAATWHIQS